MIPLFKVFMPDLMDNHIFKDILNSGKLTSGYYVKIFESMLQNYIGNPYIMVTGNNNYASLIALALCDIKNNDEVIASPMACIASNQPILNFGAKIIWSDIDPLTGTLDPNDVKKKVTSKTKAILHYHWGGYPGYIDEINAIGKSLGITVIDDAIESFGSEYKGRLIGNVNTPITTFSFQTVRLPHSIDGGAIAFNDEATFKKALLMRDFGINRISFRDNIDEISPHSDIPSFGYNAVMNELNAFIGTKILDATTSLIEKQRENSFYWNQLFNTSDFATITRAETNPNYWIYSVLSDTRDKDMMMFRRKGYFASKVHLRNDYYSCFGVFDDSLLGVETFARKQFSLPSGWWLKDYL